ncbi:MAG: endopeptidase La [Spirochaetia bacterium]|nr:endopeptidase La [Spirochaetia bacterium]
MSKIIDTERLFPLLPLRDMVVFPGNVSSLIVGREKSLDATRKAMESDRRIILVAQKNTETIIPTQSDLYETGVACEILQLLKMPDGTFKILVEGIERVVVNEFIDNPDYSQVKVAMANTVVPEPDSLEKQLLGRVVNEILQKFEDFSETQDNLSHDLSNELFQKNDHGFVLDCVAHILPIPFLQKQDILETESLLDRAEKVQIGIDNQLAIGSLEKNIHTRVRQQMDKMQRQYYLTEQIKVIREELGDGEYDEHDVYRKAFEKEGVPEEVKTKALQELAKLEKMPAMSAESAILRNYLDWIRDLPWTETTQDNEDIERARKILDESHYGLDEIKDRILEFIAVRQLAPDSKGPILCLIGPPGVGKTSLVKTMADCLDRKFARISLGGVRDEAEIRGHRRTYIGALPGRIISTLKKLNVKNPVILLDEIDKISSDYRGNPAAALLEVLDPEQNKEFADHYMELPFDLSQVMFVATANVSHSIPEALYDRLEMIQLSGYTEHEKISISQKYLLERQAKNNGVSDVDIKFSVQSLAYLIRRYTREAGVRQLERIIAKIYRKIAREYLENKQKKPESQLTSISYEMKPEMLHKYLGQPDYHYGKKEDVSAVGKCVGLAWTSAGGDTLNIEVAMAHGKGVLHLTGNLGDVMKESANAALGYIKSQAHFLGLSHDFFERTDIYLHIPEGAIPKDGPSAGITIASCLISALTQTPIKNHVALTGEITLRGKVLPIGGLKEKSLAAFRAGITDIICPKENEKDLEKIPDSIKKRMKFHFVSTMREVIPLTLENGANIFIENPGAYPFYASHLPGWENKISTNNPTPA